TNPMTLPSHTSMLAGLTPLDHGVHANNNDRLSDPVVTLAERLRADGLATGAIVSAFVLDSQFGLAQGFDDYNDRFGDLTQSRRTLYSSRPGAETSDIAFAVVEKS